MEIFPHEAGDTAVMRAVPDTRYFSDTNSWGIQYLRGDANMPFHNFRKISKSWLVNKSDKLRCSVILQVHFLGCTCNVRLSFLLK